MSANADRGGGFGGAESLAQMSISTAHVFRYDIARGGGSLLASHAAHVPCIKYSPGGHGLLQSAEPDTTISSKTIPGEMIEVREKTLCE